ncbi:MAG: alpha/beta fold hydrolase, partial [Rubrobacter sp.]
MAENKTSTVETGRYETFLNRAGEGNDEAILFLHGSGPGVVSWSNWQFALPVLGEKYDCLSLDLVGFGKTQHPEEGQYPEDMAAWINVWVDQNIALMDKLGIEKAHVVGNSMGGAVALHLVDRHPERFEKMAMMGPIGPPHEISDQINEIWGFYDDPTPEHMKTIINYFAYDPEAAVGGDLDNIAAMRTEAANTPQVRRSFEAMFPEPRQRQIDGVGLPEGAYDRMTRPALLVHGRDDHIVPLETSLHLLEHLPQVQLHIFGQCSHWTMIEYKNAFNELLLD